MALLDYQLLRNYILLCYGNYRPQTRQLMVTTLSNFHGVIVISVTLFGLVLLQPLHLVRVTSHRLSCACL